MLTQGHALHYILQCRFHMNISQLAQQQFSYTNTASSLSSTTKEQQIPLKLLCNNYLTLLTASDILLVHCSRNYQFWYSTQENIRIHQWHRNYQEIDMLIVISSFTVQYSICVLASDQCNNFTGSHQQAPIKHIPGIIIHKPNKAASKAAQFKTPNTAHHCNRPLLTNLDKNN